MQAKTSPLRRGGTGLLILALHAIVIYAIAMSLGVIKVPEFAQDMEAVIIDAPQVEEPKPIEVKPELAELTPDVPMPEAIPEIPPEVPVEAPPVVENAIATTPEAAPEVENLAVSNRVNPVYPPASRRAGEQGVVMLRVLVDERGRPGDIQVMQSSGFPRLDQAALDGVRKWTFKPAKNGSTPILSWTRVQVKFELKTS
jgi:periplasmic protein TonB